VNGRRVLTGALVREACRFPGPVALLAKSCPAVHDLADGQEAEFLIGGRHAILVHREGTILYVIGYADVSERAAERRGSAA
jgi:hypothetical protein